MMLYTKQSAAGNSQKKRNVKKKKHSEYASYVQFFRLQWHSYSVTLSTHISQNTNETTVYWGRNYTSLTSASPNTHHVKKKNNRTKGVHINYKHVYIRVYIHKYVCACGGACTRQLSVFWEKTDKSAIWAWFILMVIACCTDSDQN